MTDRDEFAAAALTGLVAGRYDATATVAIRAYNLADAMLRERERHHIPDAGKMVENPTNHNAVPSATGTGNKGESLSESLPNYCWDGVSPSHNADGEDEMRIDDECRDPELLAAELRRLRTVIAAGEPTLTDAERDAIEWCLSLPMLDRDVVRMMPLRSLLERLK